MKDEKPGSEIRADKLFEVRPGDFVYNRLFAWKGSFAIAAPEHAGCYVSNEFPCFEIDQQAVDPRWLRYYFAGESVWTEALGLSSGSTPTSRNRLKEEQLLAMSIPLPPLPEQRRIVGRIEAIVTKIREASLLREASRRETQDILRGAFERISDGARRQPLGEVAPLVRRPVQIAPGATYPELGIRSFGRGTFHKPTLYGEELTWQKLFRVHAGDIVISNIKAWEGAIGVAGTDDDGRVGSHRYLTLVPIENKATPAYLCHYLLTAEGLAQVGHASPGSADRNRTLGLNSLADIQVPVPPVAAQHWFDALQAEVQEVGGFGVDVALQIDAIVPSAINKAFQGAL